MEDAGYFEEEKEEVVFGVPIPSDVVDDTTGVDYLSARGGESKEGDFEIIGDNHLSPEVISPEVSSATSRVNNLFLLMLVVNLTVPRNPPKRPSLR